MKKLPLRIAELVIVFLVFGIFNTELMAQQESSSLILVSNKGTNNGHRGKMVSLANLLKMLEQNFEVTFLFKDNVVQQKRVNTSQIKIGDRTGQQLVDILDQLDLTYSQVDEQTYVLLHKKNIPKKLGMQEQITGVVTDGQSGETLPGVNILVKGSSNGVSTDADGTFELTVESMQDTLIVSYIGFQTQNVPINGRTEINIEMQPQVISGEEMVVVGYGTQKEENIASAVSSVKFDNQELETEPITEVGQALYGKVSGVQIISGSGRPGSESAIQIRGINSISANSSPLIVVDGNPLPDYNLNMINPVDIESVEVLKDAASAAIYGSRAANGVIMITTKSGEPGKTRVTLNYSFGNQYVIRKMDVMNGPQYAQAIIDAAQNGWIDSGGDPNAPNTIDAREEYRYVWPKRLENPEKLANTDYQDVLYHRAPMHKTNFSVSGGSEEVGTNYTLSGGYITQNGIALDTGFKKYSLNTKINNKVNSWLEMGVMANLIYGDRDLMYHRNVEWATQYPPIFPVFDPETGYLGGPSTYGWGPWSSTLLMEQFGHPYYRKNDILTQNRVNGLGNIYAAVDILQNLDFKTTLNYYYQRATNNNYEAKEHLLGPTDREQGTKIKNQNNTINYNWQNLLTYNNDFNAHHINAVVGMEYYKQEFSSTHTQRDNYVTDLVPYLPAGKDITGGSENSTERVLESYFGRVNYNFKSKYIASASLRFDGSSRFGPNNRWGRFPSFSLGWRVSEESFMDPIPAVSNLKFRVSRGLTGNDAFSEYRWISALQQENIARGNNLLVSYKPSGFTNRNLQWERTRQVNAGIDLGLFKNRIIFTGDYYKSTSDNLLLDVPIPIITGFTNNFQNAGKLENQGFELALQTHNLVGKFEWSTNLNFAHNQSEIIALGRDNATQTFGIQDGLSKVNKVGEPIYSFYTYVYDGVYKNQAEIDADPASYPGAGPGDGKYVDVNDDGELTSADRKIVGNYEPDFTWAITNTFNYRGFDLSFLFQGVDGSTTYNRNIRRSMVFHGGRNFLKGQVNRWRSEENPGDGWHQKFTTFQDGRRLIGNTQWLEDGSYIRLKNLTLGYSFSPELLSTLGMSQLRISFTGKNLWTKTDSRVPDPENYALPAYGARIDYQGDATNTLQRGLGGNSYPTAKIYSFGLNVSF